MELPLIFLGGVVKQVLSDENIVNNLIPCWQKVCVNWDSFYKNKTQRAAILKLFKILGKEKYLKAVGFLPKLLNAKYAPKINNPDLLLRKLERYRSFINNSDEWRQAWIEFVPHNINTAGQQKYREMRLQLVAKGEEFKQIGLTDDTKL